MKYDVIENYIDCPYRAYMLLTNKPYNLSLENIFHLISEKSISIVFTDKSYFCNKLKVNKSVSYFENELKKYNMSQTARDTLIKKYIVNIKSLLSQKDILINVNPSQILKITVPNIDIVELPILGYTEMLDKKNRTYYNFYVYGNFMVNDKIENFMKIRLVWHALQQNHVINNEILVNSNVIFVNFYHSIEKTCKFLKTVDSISLSHLESILLAIKLGISFPSVKPDSCNSCIFKNNCPHSCASNTNNKYSNLEVELIKSKYRNAIKLF